MKSSPVYLGFHEKEGKISNPDTYWSKVIQGIQQKKGNMKFQSILKGYTFHNHLQCYKKVRGIPKPDFKNI